MWPVPVGLSTPLFVSGGSVICPVQVNFSCDPAIDRAAMFIAPVLVTFRITEPVPCMVSEDSVTPPLMLVLPLVGFLITCMFVRLGKKCAGGLGTDTTIGSVTSGFSTSAVPCIVKEASVIAPVLVTFTEVGGCCVWTVGIFLANRKAGG